MKTYTERAATVAEKLAVEKRLRRKNAISITCGVLSIALVIALFLPFQPEYKDTSRYKSSPYYELIQKINKATAKQPKYDNAMDMILSFFDGIGGVKGNGFTGSAVAPGAPMYAPEMNDPAEAVPDGVNGEYVEITDNQVQGIIEGDIVKRSTDFIYHLYQGNELRIYSIDKDQSKMISSTDLAVEGNSIRDYTGEMYLSKDLKTVYILRSVYRKSSSLTGRFLCVTVVDVSDPVSPKAVAQRYMSGDYLSSRMVEDDLLLMTKFSLGNGQSIDFSDESTFLPQFGVSEDMHSIAAGDIYSPDELTNTQYTVVCKLSGSDYELVSSAAFLSYSDTLYVDGNTIYATRGYTEKENQKAVTQITALDYTGDTMRNLGTVTLEGRVKDQYSLDEYKGILRVVTSTSETVEQRNGMTASATIKRNVNLYCVDTETMEVKASVIGFAPEGEQAESVRFDGDTAYVCTAIVVQLTDPVYFFDLSDIDNITWKDTGTISGYSSSLVQLNNGLLLGIGYGDRRNLKLEIYRETADGVESLCSYEMDCSFADNYKSYLIDRENNLFGLAVSPWNYNLRQYLLVLFDGYDLHEVLLTDFASNLIDARAFLADGWLYMIGDEFKVQKVF